METAAGENDTEEKTKEEIAPGTGLGVGSETTGDREDAPERFEEQTDLTIAVADVIAMV